MLLLLVSRLKALISVIPTRSRVTSHIDIYFERLISFPCTLLIVVELHPHLTFIEVVGAFTSGSWDSAALLRRLIDTFTIVLVPILVLVA